MMHKVVLVIGYDSTPQTSRNFNLIHLLMLLPYHIPIACYTRALLSLSQFTDRNTSSSRRIRLRNDKHQNKGTITPTEEEEKLSIPLFPQPPTSRINTARHSRQSPHTRTSALSSQTNQGGSLTPFLLRSFRTLHSRSKSSTVSSMSSCFAATAMSDLIAGLPEEVARECLIRVGFDQLPTVRRISRQWKKEVESPDYGRLRRAERLARPVLAMVKAHPEHVDQGQAQKRGPANNYRMVLLDLVEGRWAPLPVLPGPTGSLPLFCQVAAVDGGQGRKRLVVVGGWDPVSWAPTDSVYVYDFLTGAWRRGAPMPGPRRSFFATAAVGETVFVAGGHDEEKNALRSALAYDPESDAWTALPDMAEERDEPRGLCVGGKFMVVGGYPTPAQGHFAGSVQAFDPASSTWSPVQEGLLEDGVSPRTCCVAPGAERVYMLRDGNLVARDGGASSAGWRTVAPVPEDARTACTVSAIPGGRVVVIGSGSHGGDQTVYTLHDEAGKPASWSRAPAPPGFSGHVQAACFLEI
uniref:Uncharacterized protein n=1 Tax=Avena sativa TaxID=4498 RepID=A0ACD5WU10_AVESA